MRKEIIIFSLTVQLRIAALNEDDSGEEEFEQEDEPTTTKEAEVMYKSSSVLSVSYTHLTLPTRR